MIYGMLIGLMISSLFMCIQNAPTNHRISEAAAIGRQIVKIIGSTIFVTSTCAFIGLLIRGA